MSAGDVLYPFLDQLAEIIVTKSNRSNINNSIPAYYLRIYKRRDETKSLQFNTLLICVCDRKERRHKSEQKERLLAFSMDQGGSQSLLIDIR
jgi:hypothetical protein